MEMYQEGIISICFNREFYCIRDNDREVSCQGILFYGSSEPAMISLDEKEEYDFRLLYKVLLEEFENRDHIQGEMLRVLLKRLLIKATRLVRNKIPQPLLSNEKLDLIRRFNVLVEEFYKEKHLVSDYADMLNKSHKTISNLFKKYSDKTALTFINERILVEARRLLLFSDKTSEEIAYELGYREPGHFSKFFKKQMGVSPIEFRRKVFAVAS
jgi:AraC-like DNA-binding protein